MKRNYIVWTITVVLILAGAWFGRAAWRAHRNLVTLHVRNMPLADVVRKIEWQTWERINLDKKLDALITLDIKNKPLSVVLDRLAQQAGARWTTVYAVYDSKPALAKLQTAMSGDKKLEDAGWKLIAPAGLNMDFRVPGAEAGPGGSGIVVNRGPLNPASLPPGAVVTATEDTDVVAGGSHQTGGSARPGGAAQQNAPVMRMVRRRAGGGPDDVQEEIWSPVEVVIETRLNGRVRQDFVPAASGASALETAKQVKGRCKTYYALRKSLMGMDFAGMKGPPGGRDFQIVKGNGTNSTPELKRHRAPSAEELADDVRRRQLEELGKLTPEQRVQRARERQAFKSTP